MRLNRPFLKAIPKAGYAARGVIYCIVGGFVLMAALYPGNETPGTKGALLRLFETGYGTTLLFALAAGLFCYTLWRLFQSVADADGHGRTFKGLVIRGALFTSGITHGLLGLWALTTALAGTGEEGPTAARWLMSQPYGTWLAGVAGGCMLGFGFAHAYKGVTGRYEKWFAADERLMAWMRPVAATGLVGRGMVISLIGGLLVYAGITVDPDKAVGLKEALQWLQGLPFGRALLGAAACGLLSFGLYSLLETWFRLVTSSGAPTFPSKESF